MLLRAPFALYDCCVTLSTMREETESKNSRNSVGLDREHTKNYRSCEKTRSQLHTHPTNCWTTTHYILIRGMWTYWNLFCLCTRALVHNNKNIIISSSSFSLSSFLSSFLNVAVCCVLSCSCFFLILPPLLSVAPCTLAVLLVLCSSKVFFFLLLQSCFFLSHIIVNSNTHLVFFSLTLGRTLVFTKGEKDIFFRLDLRFVFNSKK